MNMQHIYSTIAAHVLYTDSTFITYMHQIYSTIVAHVLYIKLTRKGYYDTVLLQFSRQLDSTTKYYWLWQKSPYKAML